MPLGTLVIGVGGTGKGVLNWLKRTLEEEGDGTENVKFLCIDSVAEDNFYAFPSSKKYFLDFSNTSSEFFKLGKDPVPFYQKIRDGVKCPFISDWLSQEDAKNSPDEALKPEGGLGQNRAAGRVVFFLSDNELYSKIKSVIGSLIGNDGTKKATDSQDILWDIFIVGSPTGGTGSGCFIDTVNLVRKIVSEKESKGMRIIGIISLPECFDKVFNDPSENVFKDARSFAFYREIIRMMYANWSPVDIEYSESLEVNNQLFLDFCFLVNGVNDKVNLGSEVPMFGVCPAISDFIFTLIKDPGEIHADLRNDMTQLALTEPSSKFSTFGISKLLFPYKDLVNTFKYKFVYDLLNELVKDSPGISAGESEVNQFLRGLKFMQAVLDYNRSGEVKISPPNSPAGLSDLMDMINSFHTGVSGKDQIFPSSGNSPVRQIGESVEYTTSFLHRVYNRDFINSCERDLNEYLGTGISNNIYTVRGWVNYQKELLLKVFEESLFEHVKSIFYDPSANDFKKLSETEPNVLMKGYKFLESVKDYCKSFAQYIENIVENYNKQGNPIEFQKQKIEKLKNKMLINPESTNKSEQMEFINEFQVLLNLNVWFILLEGFKDISTEMSRIAEKLWLLFGDPAKGWVNTLLNSIGKIKAELNNISTLRMKLEEIPTRRYYPAPGSDGENKIYEDYILGKGYLVKILNEMSWIFVKEDTPQTYGLQLQVPSGLVESGEIQNIEYAFGGITKWTQVSEFNLDKLLGFAEKFIAKELRNINLWLALSYDLNNGVSREIEDFAKQGVDYLTGISKPLLSIKEVQKSEYLERIYYISNFISSSSPKEAYEVIANVFSSSLEVNKVFDVRFNNSAIAVSFKHKIPFQNWAKFEIVLNNYFKYLDKNSFPIHIFQEEKNASFIENYLKTRFHQQRTQPLNPKIVSVLKDRSYLQVYVLAYLLGILDSEFKEHEKPDDSLSPLHYVIKGRDRAGIPFSIDLGESKDILNVIKEFMKKENHPAREILKRRVSESLRDNARNKIIGLLTALDNREISLEPNLEGDLKDVFKVVIHETLEKLQ
ncbi:MAG: tubulin-like doman-containing protein [archaeon]